MTCAVITSPHGFERRARRLPWGIQIEVWRLIETRTLPNESAQLSLGLLFADDDVGAIPNVPVEDEKTLENLVDETTLREPVDCEYGPDPRRSSGGKPDREPA